MWGRGVPCHSTKKNLELDVPMRSYGAQCHFSCSVGKMSKVMNTTWNFAWEGPEELRQGL
jgi:hypothetical protein